MPLPKDASLSWSDAYFVRLQKKPCKLIATGLLLIFLLGFCFYLFRRFFVVVFFVVVFLVTDVFVEDFFGVFFGAVVFLVTDFVVEDFFGDVSFVVAFLADLAFLVEVFFVVVFFMVHPTFRVI